MITENPTLPLPDEVAQTAVPQTAVRHFMQRMLKNFP